MSLIQEFRRSRKTSASEGSLSNPTNRARLTAKFSLERLRLQVAGQLSQQFPGDHSGPKQWLSLVTGLLDTADDYLVSSEHLGVKPDDALNLIRDAVRLGTEAYKCLAFMRGTTMVELPYPIVRPLQRWFDQLQVCNSTFFRAELVANYELRFVKEGVFRGIRDPSPSLTESINQVSWPLLRVTVPSRAFASIPHLAIVAHEIGHALFTEVNWDTNSFRPEEDAVKQRIAARLGVTVLDRQTQDILSRVFFHWFQELSADAFAHYLTGPAIFFSLSEFAQLHGGGYTLSESHPASDLRRSILFNKLCEGGANSFMGLFKRHTGAELTEDFNSALLQRTPDKTQFYKDATARNVSPEMAAVLAELHESIPRAVSIVYDHVFEYLRTHARDAIYSPDQYDQDLTEHLNPMLAAVPPIEVGRDLAAKAPAEFASILNVGWAVLLTKLPELRVKTSGPDQFRSERLERLHDLLLKAVELSEARRTWQSV